MATLAVSTASAQTADTIQATAFEDAQMAASSKAAVAFAQNAARASAGDPDLTALVRARQEAETRWLAIDDQRAAALSKAGSAAQTETAALDKLQRDTQAEVDRADKVIAERYPAFADLMSPAPLALADTQRLLGADEGLVLLVPAKDAVFVWTVRRDAASWSRAALSRADLDKAVLAIRAALDPGADVRAAVDATGGTTSAVAAFPRAAAFELYRRLWGPSEATLAGARTVYVVAAGPLAALPFSVLVTGQPSGDDADPADLRRTDWLIRRHALATLPSVSSLRLIRRLEAGRSASSPFAGFGDPALDGAPSLRPPRGVEAFYRGGVADAEAVKGLPRLPNTRAELKAIARALGAAPATVVVGADATERRVRSADLSEVKVIAFATHGLLAGELGTLNEPALVLTPPAEVTSADDDGLLTASEAARLTLNADWIVLSACNTGGGDGTADLGAGGEGLSGLTRAFFHAGGRSLLVSNWRVRDDAAARLTTATIRYHAARPAEGRPEALRRSMLALMNDPRFPDAAQPSVWAPFTVIGR